MGLAASETALVLDHMPAAANQEVVFGARPAGAPDGSTFELRDCPTPAAGAGEVVVEALYFSVDPCGAQDEMLRACRCASASAYQRPVFVSSAGTCAVECRRPRAIIRDLLSRHFRNLDQVAQSTQDLPTTYSNPSSFSLATRSTVILGYLWPAASRFLDFRWLQTQ